MIADCGIRLFKLREMFHSPENIRQYAEYPFSVKEIQGVSNWTDVIFNHSINFSNFGITHVFIN